MKALRFLFILSTYLLLAFVEGDKSLYTVPQSPWTVYASDVDLNGDIDVLIGHKYSSNSGWGGISILTNQGYGNFGFSDSLYFENGFSDISGGYFDNNNYIDVYSTTVTANPYTIYITVIYNYGISGFDSIKSFPIDSNPPVPFISSGDVNGDGYEDLLFAYNNTFMWGIRYNDGTGNFSFPEYFVLTFPPIDIACADLNDDGRDDVIIAGSYTEIFYSDTAGFLQQTLGYTWTTGCKILVCDFDNDNVKDILIVGGVEGPHTRIYMFKNLGNNQFQQMPDYEFDQLTQYAQTSDFNNDSLPDIVFCAHDNSGLYIYYNTGNFQLAYQNFIPIETNNALLRRVACADFDGNNFNDIVLIKSWGAPYEGNVMFLFNDGEGNFVNNPVTKISVPNCQSNNFNCYPNPFRSQCSIQILSNKAGKIDIYIYSMNGVQIKSIENEKNSPGQYKFTWDGTDKNGKEVNPGTYLVRLNAGSQIFTDRVVKIK